jgi:hypothetical protein
MKRERVKLVRHEDRRVDVAELYRQGRFELYQSYQADHVFRKALLEAFTGLQGTFQRFVVEEDFRIRVDMMF